MTDSPFASPLLEKFPFLPAWHSTHVRPSNRLRNVLLLAGVLMIGLLSMRKLSPKFQQIPSISSPSNNSPYAYVTLLVSSPDHDNKTVSDDEDKYFVGTRTLVYQLLHSAETGTNTSIPMVVIASEDIAPHKVARLEKDGAIVKVVQNIQPSWMKPGVKKWRHMMNKLYLFTLTQYEKVLFLDADTLIVKRLDHIFTDPTTSPLQTNHTLAKEDEGPLPDTYILAAQAAFESANHPYPPPPEFSAKGHLSGGFFLTAPSLPLFEHYQKVIGIEGRFRDNAMEQDLLNYVHRRGGPMPWAAITYTWTTTWPSEKELKAGAATLHNKFWEDDFKIDLAIRKLWLLAKGEMLGFWHNKEGKSSSKW